MLVLPYTHRSPRNRGASRFALCGAEVNLDTDERLTRKDDEADCPRCRDLMATRVEMMLDMGKVGSRPCPACNGSKEGKWRKPCLECAALGKVPADSDHEEVSLALEALRVERNDTTALAIALDWPEDA